MTAEWAKDFAAEWIESWNAHDLDRVLTHYAESVEFFSPFISQVLGEASGRICGKGALIAYFAKALEAYPNLRFDLYTVLSGVKSLTVLYRSVKNLLAAEVMLFDDAHRVTVVFAHYANDNRQLPPLGSQSD